MGNFVHLHLHTEFSLLDGAARVEKVVKRAKELNMPAIAITDHGNMYGAMTFYDECVKQGIKPILGCEFYVCNDLTNKSGRERLNHLILLAKNEEGYKTLCKLNTIAFKDGYYYKPRIDLKTLEQYHNEVICLSACIAGNIPQLILSGDIEGAENLTLWFKNLFKDDFYLEIQNHFLPEDKIINSKLKEFATKHNIKTVATNDAHYINREDAEAQDVLMCVQMQTTVTDPDRLKFPNDEFFFKTREEMEEIFPEDFDALDTTLEIADKCQIEFKQNYLYPKYITPTGQEPMEFMLDLIEEGKKRRYPNITKEIQDRIDYELSIISRLGFIEYYLTVWDYINAARNMGISVGPGRGSGAGSVVAYLIGITQIDPIKYELYFERFLNPERVSAPDFDVDFEDCRRQEVIGYVRDKYGADRVIKIMTLGTMAAKNAIKDVGRAMSVPYSQTDKITKQIPNTIKRPNILMKAFGFYKPKEGAKDYGVNYAVPELVDIYNSDAELKKVVDIAIKLEDMPRQQGVHACGVIIGKDSLDKYVPLARSGDDITTQYTGVQMEHLGHLKMDFLGLRNLSDIKECINIVKQNYGIEVDFEHSDYADPKVYELISTGNTKGIFQLESAGFQKFMKELKPTCLEDIVAGVSLYRPGPMDSIPKFVHNKHNPQDVTYDDPCLEPILNYTYGCIVYQEQVMRIVQDMAGYTLGAADNVRRMMGKKQIDKMIKEKEVFLYGKPAEGGKPAIDGALKRGVNEDVARKIWGEMESFASYAFNKSHAAAYSMVTYQTAYLKCYYRPEFITSVLNNRITNIDEIINYVAYAKEEKIEVLPPDINLSKTLFTTNGKSIRFGLAALKNVGVGVIDKIIEERDANGPFKDLVDFTKRVPTEALNKRCIESLILSGAFDCFNRTRSDLMAVYPMAIERAIDSKKTSTTGQFTMFDTLLKDDAVANELNYPNNPEFTKKVKLSYEKESAGIYLSGHPLDEYSEIIKTFTINSSMLLDEQENEENLDENEKEEITSVAGFKNGDFVTCGGTINELKLLMTKTGKRMAFVTLEDLTGTIDCVAFNSQYEKFKDLLVEDNLIKIKGRLSLREGQKPSVSIDSVELLQKEEKNETEQTEIKEEQIEKPKKLYLKFDLTNIELKTKIEEILKTYEGNSEVVVKNTADNKGYKLPLKVECLNALLFELSTIMPKTDMIVQ